MRCHRQSAPHRFYPRITRTRPITTGAGLLSIYAVTAFLDSVNLNETDRRPVITFSGHSSAIYAMASTAFFIPWDTETFAYDGPISQACAAPSPCLDLSCRSLRARMALSAPSRNPTGLCRRCARHTLLCGGRLLSTVGHSNRALRHLKGHGHIAQRCCVGSSRLAPGERMAQSGYGTCEMLTHHR